MAELHVEEKKVGAAGSDSSVRPGSVPLAVAAVALGFAIEIHNGEYTPIAIGLVTLALIAGTISVAAPHLILRLGLPVRRLVVGTIGVGLALQLAALLIVWPGVDLPRHGGMQLVPFHTGLIASAGLLAAGLFGASSKIRSIWFPLLLAVFLFLGIWMVRSSPQPHIDVWWFQQQGPAALLHGHNPYAMTFPDIYHSTRPGAQQVYGTGLVVNDRLQFGFPYPPVSLLLATIGYALAGDHRYAQVVALVLAGLFIGYSRGSRGKKTTRGRGDAGTRRESNPRVFPPPSTIAMLAAALLLFTPRIFFVIGRAWTEPFVVMLLAATVFCAVRRSRWLPVALGLFLATKQYLIFAVPLTFFLLPPGWRWRDWFDLLWKTALVAAAVTLPFVLWDFRAFWKSTITVQEIAPFRWDALSYLVWYGFRGHSVTGPFTAVFWSTLAALVALGLALWRSVRTPAGFAASLALLSLGFFAFNKQAFCNYYFFVIGALCCAIAASMADASEGEPPTASRVPQ